MTSLGEVVGETARTAYCLAKVAGGGGPTGDVVTGGGAAPHEDALLSFYGALHMATLLEGDILRLSEGIYWRGTPKRGSSLYVRPYPGLYA